MSAARGFAQPASICLAVLLAVVAGTVSASSSQDAASAPQVRTDGVYYVCVHSNPADPANPICTYVRFFDDGSGLTVLSADKPDQVARWLTKESSSGERGWYSVSGDKLTLRVAKPNGEVTYEGTLTPDSWKVGGRTSYQFAAAGPAAESPDGNRIPIVSGAISVHNRVSLGPTGQQEGLTSTVTINASDPDGDALTFTWSASNGRLSASGNQAVWQRPVQYGRPMEGTLVVAVQDSKGAKTTRAWVMY